MVANTIVVVGFGWVAAAAAVEVVAQPETKSSDTFRTVVGRSCRRFRRCFHRSNCCYNETRMSTLIELNHNVMVSGKVTIVMIQHWTGR